MRAHQRRDLDHLVEQRLLGVLLQQRDVRLARRALGLLQDVDDALVGSGQGLGLGQRAEGLDRSELGRHQVDARGLQRQHGVDHGAVAAGLAEQVLQALEHEVLQLRGEALGGQQAGLEAGGGGVDQLRQPERQRRLDQDAEHAERGAAQRERILVAGGHHADAEEADQGVELVGQRHRGGDVARGQRVAGKARLVVGLDGVGHHLALAVGERVVAAHDALQLGELAHHVGDEVGLGQARGALRRGDVAVQLGGDRACQRLEALDALELAAELVVIDHRRQARQAGLELLLLVLLEEEARVRQARAHHAGVAGDDVARVGHPHVGDDQEAVEQLAGAVEEREVLLVGAHGQDQAFLRHGEEFGLEFAHVHRRVLDQRGDLVEQVGVFVQQRALLRRLGEQLALDVGAALGEVGDDLAFGEQRGLVGVGGGDGKVAAAHEAVATRGAPGIQVEHAARHHVGAVQQRELVHRAHEGGVAVAPAHDLGDRQGLDGILHDGRQHVGEPGARHGSGVEQRLGLAVHAALEAGQSGIN